MTPARRGVQEIPWLSRRFRNNKLKMLKNTHVGASVEGLLTKRGFPPPLGLWGLPPNGV